MSSVAQAPVTRERFDTLVAELYGDRSSPASQPAERPSAQQAIVQAAEQVAAQPTMPVDPARLTKAMDLVLVNAVRLLPDGTARVKSGSHTYHLAPDCTCEDAQRHGKGCKHKLAVEIHRRATALLEGTASTPAAHSASQAAAVAAPPPAAPPVAPSAPASHAWDVHEAPASACFKFRVGTMELMYTLRGVDDAELQRRITATLPTLQEVIEACEERAAQRAAAREAAQAALAVQALPAPPPAGAPADLQALLQQAVQQALATPANGQAKGQAARQGKPSDQQTGQCSLHDVEMELRQNERGAWYSHYLDDEGRYCKGATK